MTAPEPKTSQDEALRVTGCCGIKNTYSTMGSNPQARAGWQIGYQEALQDMLSALARGGLPAATAWARANGTEATRQHAEGVLCTCRNWSTPHAPISTCPLDGPHGQRR